MGSMAGAVLLCRAMGASAARVGFVPKRRELAAQFRLADMTAPSDETFNIVHTGNAAITWE